MYSHIFPEFSLQQQMAAVLPLPLPAADPARKAVCQSSQTEREISPRSIHLLVAHSIPVLKQQSILHIYLYSSVCLSSFR